MASTSMFRPASASASILGCTPGRERAFARPSWWSTFDSEMTGYPAAWATEAISSMICLTTSVASEEECMNCTSRLRERAHIGFQEALTRSLIHRSDWTSSWTWAVPPPEPSKEANDSARDVWASGAFAGYVPM